MNEVIIPDGTDATPDEVLLEFGRRGNRVGLLEEIYRRANGHETARHIAQSRGVAVDDVEAVVDVAVEVFREVDTDDFPRTDRTLMLRLSYGEVADHVLEHVETE